MPADPGLLGAAQRLLEASDHVGIDRDTLQEAYYEWCAAVTVLKDMVEERLNETSDGRPTPAQRRENAEDGYLWVMAYENAGFTHDEAVQIVVASVGRPLPPPESTE